MPILHYFGLSNYFSTWIPHGSVKINERTHHAVKSAVMKLTDQDTVLDNRCLAVLSHSCDTTKSCNGL